MKRCPPVFTFAASAQGERHKKYGQPCQDFSLHYRDDSRAFAVVSDGHGSEMCFRSDRGSRFACEAAAECINGFIDQFGQSFFTTKHHIGFNLHLNNICCGAIHAAWKRRALEDWKNDPPDFETLDLDRSIYDENLFAAYGCTLLAVAATDAFWFGIHIGDGKCVVLEQDGTFSEPIPWDENCQFNITTSLCEENAVQLFRYYVGEELPEAIFVGTDGVDTSFPLEGNGEKLAGLYRIILDNFKREGFETGREQLEEFLPVLTGRGSGDDVSIAGILFGGEEYTHEE